MCVCDGRYSTYEVEKNGTRDIATAGGFVEVHIDAFKLEIALTTVLLVGVDTW